MEPRADRWLFAALVLALLAGFLASTHAYWVPAHPGVDENGYLVGGRVLLERGMGGLAPLNPVTGQRDPYLFVGGMWIGADLGTPAERYYPKYPIGFATLVALALKLGGPAHGPLLAYWINPICMTLGVAATFMLVRLLAGSFLAFLATLAVAASPVTLGLVNDPNSHASALCCATWGMYLLLRSWHSGGAWRAAVAGLLLGCAATVRYTEAMLLLPLLLVAFFGVFPGRPSMRPRSWLTAGLLVFSWAVPVLVLVCYNFKAFGTLTGYDPTNESSGFRWEYFRDNWDAAFRQIESFGLFFLLPAALAGLALMFAWNWRMALVLTSWVVPSMLVYTAYYWAPDPTILSIGYTRFFLTILPGLAMAAMWLMAHLRDAAPGPAAGGRKLATAVIGLLCGIAAMVNLSGGITLLETRQIAGLATQVATNEVLDLTRRGKLPAGSFLLSDNNNLLHHLQFVGDYVLYSTASFNRSFMDRLPANVDPNDPQFLQPQRRQAMYDRLAGMSPQQLVAEQQQILRTALDSGRRVFLLVSRRGPNPALLARETALRDAAPASQPLPDGLGLTVAAPPPVRPAAAGAAGALRWGSAPQPLARLLGREFDAQVVSVWSNPLQPPRAQAAQRQPFRNMRLPPPPAAREAQWQILEITRKPTPPGRPRQRELPR